MHSFLFPRRLSWILFCLLAWQNPGFSYQLADGERPAAAPASKFIFYWGSLQCDLSATNNYHGTMEATPAVFRQMLLSAPHIWDGTKLVSTFAFYLEEQPVNTSNYATQIGGLDATFAQKVVLWQVLHLSKLALTDKISASIDLRIVEPAQKDAGPAIDYWRHLQSSFVNTKLVEHVTWGREDAYDISNRDFFTVAEFWQTVRQMPYVEWQPYSIPQSIIAVVRFPDQPVNFSLRTPLESTEYRQMLTNLDNYRHLAAPGATAELALNTAESYDELYLKTMRLVSENDPRLALRRNRDTHVLEFNWGRQIGVFRNLYLQNFKQESGPPESVDFPLAARFGVPKTDLENLIGAQPIIRIDEHEMPEFSFRLKLPDSSFYTVTAAEHLPDSILQNIVANFQKDFFSLVLDSFAVTGYELPPIMINLTYFNPGDLLPVQNNFTALMHAGGSVRVKQSAPTSDKQQYYFDFELPAQATIKFSIFEPEGENIVTIDFQFSAGTHSVAVPKNKFRKKGKHYCFLNTPLGVNRIEFEVE